jgi:hypothetical protein
MGSKTLSLRDNQLKSFTRNKSNRVEFIDETYKHKRELCIIYKKWQNFDPPPPVECTDDPIKSKGFKS